MTLPILAIAALAVAQPDPGAGASGIVAYRARLADGAQIDWGEGQVEAIGKTPILSKIADNLILYRRTIALAEEHGRKELMRLLRDLPLDGSSRVKDRPEVASAAERYVATLFSEAVESDTGSILRVRMKGSWLGTNGLLSLVLPERRDEPLPDTMPQGPDGPTGLVVDAASLRGLGPVLLPRIVDETGRVVHSAQTADPDYARQWGLLSYRVRVPSGTEPPAPELPRQGERPLQVQAVRVGEAGASDIVIATTDADRILHEAAGRPFLRECRIVVLMPPPPLPPARVRAPRRNPGIAEPADPNRPRQ